MVIAVLLLIANAMISSRLSLLMACAVYLATWVRSRKPRQASSRARRWIAIALIALSGFAVLTALTTSATRTTTGKPVSRIRWR